LADLTGLEVALAGLEEPLLGRSLGELGLIQSVEGRRLGPTRVTIGIPAPNHPRLSVLDRVVREALSAAGVRSAEVSFVPMDDAARQALVAKLSAGPGVGKPGSATRVVAVGSGKGGVGKSSVTTNLAVGLAEAGHSVGVIDADIWGFSIPKMLGIEHPPLVVEEKIIPPRAHGVKAMSMDYFVDEDTAVIWRGPMLHKAIEQFITDVLWDSPDFLLVDMPPGTGDVAISLSQFLPRAQVLLVTTPQPTAQRVARRAGLMAKKVNQEVLGVVENMSWFTGDDGRRYELFGQGGGAALAGELGVPLMAQIPLIVAMREGADEGVPAMIAAPQSEAAEAFRNLVKAVVERRPRVRTRPELVIKG
jgi:ATP-binding protein involved in chromosome partitioning